MTPYHTQLSWVVFTYNTNYPLKFPAISVKISLILIFFSMHAFIRLYVLILVNWFSFLPTNLLWLFPLIFVTLFPRHQSRYVHQQQTKKFWFEKYVDVSTKNFRETRHNIYYQSVIRILGFQRHHWITPKT